MANLLWTNEEISHHKPYSCYSPSQETSKFASWTSEEDKTLFHYLSKDSSESSSRISLYTKIAACLENKTIRDVAIRCKLIDKKETAKRRKIHHNGLGTDRVDSVSNSSHMFAQAYLPHEEYGITNELLNHNKHLFDQISANFKSLKLTDNLILFSKSIENIREILTRLNENVSEPMKHMPPLAENLNEELFYAIKSSLDFLFLLEHVSVVSTDSLGFVCLN